MLAGNTELMTSNLQQYFADFRAEIPLNIVCFTLEILQFHTSDVNMFADSFLVQKSNIVFKFNSLNISHLFPQAFKSALVKVSH